ncbi:MAG: hypothetical protein KIT16_22785, partial [Rhodospirillaceae bacterium]|nr:hypothetical protein [Rhodospirillaceae bacterium]
MTPPAARASLAEAASWIDRHVARLGAETVALADALGRIAAADVLAAVDVPAGDCAALDGYGLRAEETVGASAYNPIPLHDIAPAAALPAGAAMRLDTGAALADGIDAVIALDHVETAGDGRCDVIEPVAVGMGIERRGSQARAGAAVLAAGHAIGPHTLGLLAA